MVGKKSAAVNSRAGSPGRRIIFSLLASAFALGALYYFPISSMPPSWQSSYYKLIGEAPYQAPPSGQAPNVAPMDMAAICPPEYASWRDATVIENIAIEGTTDCMADNPWEIAAAIKGTNNVGHGTLMQTLFAEDAIKKSQDLDGDGDPDIIEIRLEVAELNGKSPDLSDIVPQYEVGPGINPGMWVFAPKTRGMSTENFESLKANRLLRAPAPVIRVEQGDQVTLVLENTHHQPHTIHLHGVDHPFQNPEGRGNDGVPILSEAPVMPGKARRYVFTPRQSGTMFYHCHVQPQSHILMGLQGMIVIEENRPDNFVQTMNIGGGRVRARSVAVRENYDREYDLQYTDIDLALNDQIKKFTDPRLTSRAVHREYDIRDHRSDLYLLNGKAFPYTLRESIVVVGEGERVKARVLNAGAEGLALHLHGHKAKITHLDGIAANPAAQIQRDVVWLASAQRTDLEILGVNDGLNSYGPGAWLMHNHREQGIASMGVGPGGSVSLVAYPEFLQENGLPKLATAAETVAPLFDPAFFEGKIPVFAGSDHHLANMPDNHLWILSRDGRFATCLIGLFIFTILAFSVPGGNRNTGNRNGGGAS